MKRLSLCILLASSLAFVSCSDDEPTADSPILARTSFDVPDATCNPFEGARDVTTAIGVTRYAWSVDDEAIRLDLTGDSDSDLGTIE
ncbi:MAG: hypothetical protein AAFY60_21355, partial [Myxococcota bacterium]